MTPIGYAIFGASLAVALIGHLLSRLFARREKTRAARAALEALLKQRELQASPEELENRIAAAQRLYDEAVTKYNTTIGRFPTVLFAKLLGFTKAA